MSRTGPRLKQAGGAPSFALYAVVFFACRACTGGRQTAHSGQPPDPYRCVGCPQDAHGPTCAGGHVGEGGFGLSVSMTVIVRTRGPHASRAGLVYAPTAAHGPAKSVPTFEAGVSGEGSAVRLVPFFANR